MERKDPLLGCVTKKNLDVDHMIQIGEVHFLVHFRDFTGKTVDQWAERGESLQWLGNRKTIQVSIKHYPLVEILAYKWSVPLSPRLKNKQELTSQQLWLTRLYRSHPNTPIGRLLDICFSMDCQIICSSQCIHEINKAVLCFTG